ncbi:MAG: endolytic transglycosylase MltG [bacterium]
MTMRYLRSRRNVVLSFTAVLSVFAISFLVALFVFFASLGPASSKFLKRTVEIKTGSSARDFAEVLYRNGLIMNKESFLILAKVRGTERKLKAGEYEFNTRMSSWEILEWLETGRNKQHRYTIPEGYNIFQIAELLHNEGLADRERFIKAAFDPSLLADLGLDATSVEGYLFPDTYTIPRNMGEKQIIKMMYRRFEERVLKGITYRTDVMPILDLRCSRCHNASTREGNYDLSDYNGILGPGSDITPNVIPGDGSSLLLTFEHPKGVLPEEDSLTPDELAIMRRWIVDYRAKEAPTFAKEAADMGFTIHQIVTLASIIEKETGIAEERPVVSSVYHNRLKLGWNLYADPSILYAIVLDDPSQVNKTVITKEDIYYSSPYNTYIHAGLPPGPIANPGEAAIEAALHPAKTQFYYMVSMNNNRHKFSKTIDEHNRAVYEYQIMGKRGD